MPIQMTAEGQALTEQLETEILNENDQLKAEIKEVLRQLRERLAGLDDAEKIKLSDQIVGILKETRKSTAWALSSLHRVWAEKAGEKSRETETPVAQVETADEQALLKILMIPLDQLDFKVSKSSGKRTRALNAITAYSDRSPGIRVQYVGDIAELNPAEIYRRTFHIGKKTTALIQETLADLGIRMGAKLDPKVKQAFERKSKKTQWTISWHTTEEQRKSGFNTENDGNSSTSS